ncbi:hypothetical protein [Acetobacter oeni]|uniref:Uncharacterized protein n=1 Tax=Acetobacter oeni TaxID=304077 RepID=A0A511XKY9_9PROT|nr:hypothetical protein [Acetobacter oeni]MBB3883231.1 hypothetical protein [Acetobacter oeni]NHO19297.1 hypothetical protein [Acetobacter oeni]GEN63620.1 hypothetical protein AOE01nite_18440 [Acetobacter oeni]
MAGQKVLKRVAGAGPGAEFASYEIHVGKEERRGDVRPFAWLGVRSDAVDHDMTWSWIRRRTGLLWRWSGASIRMLC